jgi:transposase-like protein
MYNNILHQVPSEAKIKRELKKVVFGKILFCPRCGSRSLKKYEGRYRCKKCRKPFSLTSATWLKGMKLPLETFWLLLWCWTNKVPIDQTMKTCGASQPTTRRWFDKFRTHLPEEKLEEIRLKDTVQMDEAYRGGKKKGYAILGAKQKASGNTRRKIALSFIPKPSVDRKDAVEFITHRIEPKSKLNTDGAAIYKGIGNWWPLDHTYEIHSKFEFAITSEIEGLWGNYTTFVRRMYHHVTRDKVPQLLTEFVARFVYPEWFRSPESFLQVAFNKIERPYVTPGKPRKIQREILHTETFTFPLQSLQKQSAYVPS